MLLNYKLVLTICVILAVPRASSNLNSAMVNENLMNDIEIDHQDPNVNALIDNLILISQNYRTSILNLDQNSNPYIDKTYSFYVSVSEVLSQNNGAIKSFSSQYVTFFSTLTIDISKSLTLMGTIKSHVEEMEKQILLNQLSNQIPILEANRQKQFENQKKVEAELKTLKETILNKAQCKLNDALTSILLQGASRVGVNEKAKNKLPESSDPRLKNIKKIIDSCNAGFFASFPPTVCYIKGNVVQGSQIPYRCPSGFEKKMEICYEKCLPGYYHECCRCYPICSYFLGPGYSDSLLFCTSTTFPLKSYMKTVYDPKIHYNFDEEVKCDVSELGGY